MACRCELGVAQRQINSLSTFFKEFYEMIEVSEIEILTFAIQLLSQSYKPINSN